MEIAISTNWKANQRSGFMKKIISLILFMILIFSAFGCKQTANEEILTAGDEELNTSLTIEDYYPFIENRVMVYEGIGNEYAEMKTFVEFIGDSTIQIKLMNPGTEFVNVLENKDGILREVFGEGEFYHIENMLKANRNQDNIILKEPIILGNTWEDRDGNKVEITGINKGITIPLGEYKALEVTTTYKESTSKKDYYVKDLGFVGTIYEDREYTISSLLKSIDNTGLELRTRVYYPEANDTGSSYVNKLINFKTNGNIKNMLEELLKNPESDRLLAPISKDTKINSIKLNRDTWTLNVDMSEGFIKDMNAGSAYEVEIINSIVNSLGEFYDVEKVYISVEGEPYESGHLKLLENEYFTVNTSEIKELKNEQ